MRRLAVQKQLSEPIIDWYHKGLPRLGVPSTLHTLVRFLLNLYPLEARL